MSVLKVENLNKKYPTFTLENVSFELKEGEITGFIGRNGAGKSTTLNCLFDYVHPDSGNISFFDMSFCEHQTAIKQRIGFVSSGVNYYPKKKLKKISEITSMFYSGWDEAAYKRYMQMFSLDENKTPSELSAGMKVKYALTLGLSHNADLLILDEPTSGLDPVSRDDLLDVFMGLCDEGKTILFSTHITSDLDKCAKNIIYIKNGKIIADEKSSDFENGYKIVNFGDDEDVSKYENIIIGKKRTKEGFSALIRTSDIHTAKLDDKCENADLDEIMVHIEKGGNDNA